MQNSLEAGPDTLVVPQQTQDRLRCGKCGSSDLWRWARARGWRRFFAHALDRRWLQCRSCAALVLGAPAYRG